MFCKHEWKVLSEVTTKSKFSELAGVTRMKSVDIEELTARKHILTVTCEKCGDIKQFVNEI